MNATCPDCERWAEHCHGTLVRHVGGPPECTDAACGLPDTDRHDLVVVCAELAGCGCTDVPAGGGRRN